jgi:hypothetical protein
MYVLALGVALFAAQRNLGECQKHRNGRRQVAARPTTRRLLPSNGPIRAP